MQTKSLNMLIGAQFICGMLNSLRTTVGFVYLMELTPNHLQQRFGTCWGLYEASIFAFGTYYFWKLSNDMKLLLQIGFATNLISFLLSTFLPESPVFLLQKGRLTEAR